MDGIADDLRQAFVVGKNEITKYARGKKLLIFGVIIIVIAALLSALPYVLGSSYEDPDDVALTFVSFLAIIMELAGVLFAAGALVSEFEDRTALMLFTKPVRKWSIFVGKLSASIVIVTVMCGALLLYIMLFSKLATGDVTPGFGTLFLLTVAAVFAICGLSMLMSAISKKSSTATILTLVMLLLLLGLIEGIIQTSANVETWWMLTNALDSLIFVFGPVGGVSMTDAEILRAAGVMVAWGVVTNVIAFLLFRKRDF